MQRTANGTAVAFKRVVAPMNAEFAFSTWPE
jgi:hypothetical protein